MIMADRVWPWLPSQRMAGLLALVPAGAAPAGIAVVSYTLIGNQL